MLNLAQKKISETKEIDEKNKKLHQSILEKNVDIISNHRK